MLAGTPTRLELVEIARSRDSEAAGELTSSSHTLLCPATTFRGLQTTLTICDALTGAERTTAKVTDLVTLPRVAESMVQPVSVAVVVKATVERLEPDEIVTDGTTSPKLLDFRLTAVLTPTARSVEIVHVPEARGYMVVGVQLSEDRWAKDAAVREMSREREES